MKAVIICALCTVCFVSAGQTRVLDHTFRDQVLRDCSIVSQGRYKGNYDWESARRANYAACMTAAGERE
jgi:hypothetical protein